MNIRRNNRVRSMIINSDQNRNQQINCNNEEINRMNLRKYNQFKSVRMNSCIDENIQMNYNYNNDSERNVNNNDSERNKKSRNNTSRFKSKKLNAYLKRLQFIYLDPDDPNYSDDGLNP